MSGQVSFAPWPRYLRIGVFVVLWVSLSDPSCRDMSAHQFSKQLFGGFVSAKTGAKPVDDMWAGYELLHAQ